MEGTIVVNIFAFKSLNAMNYKFVKMLFLTVLALAVAVEGYRLNSFDSFDRSPPSPPSPMGVNMIRNMCIENGANYTAVETAAVEFVTCMETDFQVKMFESELTEALAYNTYYAINGVFKKYCRKTPAMKACYHNMVKVVAPCFGNEKEDLVKISNKMNDQILDYFCEDDGVIITKFIMEGGLQCFQQKTYDIMVCSEMAKNSVLSMDRSPISVNASFRVYDNLINCILQSVETCHNPIPSRIVKKVGEIIKQIISEEINNVTTSVPTEQIRNESTSTNTTDRGWYNPTTSTERYRYRQTTSTERNWYKPTTSTERNWYKPTTSTERYWYKPRTSTESYWHRPTTSTESYWYRPRTSTESYWYRPTTSTDSYWYRPRTSTESYWYRPRTSTESYWYRPTTSTERYWHRPTTSTERYWYKPTTTTEQVMNHVNTAWQNKKGLPTDGSNNNLQELFGNNGIESNTDQDTKNVTCGSLKKLFKLSGTLNVAFNANLYV